MGILPYLALINLTCRHFLSIAPLQQKRYSNTLHSWAGLVLVTHQLRNNFLVMLSGTVFIDRANRSSALKTFDTAVKQMKQNKVHYSLARADYSSKVSGFSQKELVPMPIVPCSFHLKRGHFTSLFKLVFLLSLSS
jgi:hypothetical protein